MACGNAMFGTLERSAMRRSWEAGMGRHARSSCVGMVLSASSHSGNVGTRR